MQITKQPKEEGKGQRYRAECPECGRVVERSSKASVEHNMKVHLIYQHDKQLV